MKALWFCLILSTGYVAQAQDVRWTHYGIRPLAMGNAYVAVADDYNALFYNPAGIARIPEWTGEFLNPYGEISNSTASFISDAMDIGGGSAGNTQDILDLIESQTGKVQHLAIGMTPHLLIPAIGFGMGIGFELNSTMIFHRYPTIDMDVGPNVILPFTFAYNFLENRLSIGASAKVRVSGGLDHEFSIQDIEAFTTKKDEKTIDEGEKVAEDTELSDYVQGGLGYGADFGILFTPMKPMAPTLGLSVTDIGGTSFEKTNISGTAIGNPEIVLPSVNAGFSIRPYENEGRYFLIAVDAHSINQPYSFSKKLNLGSEFALGKMFKVQMGLHQGYLSGGFQFDVRLLKIRFATYSEEMGASAGTLEDRRYALQLKLLI